MKKGYVKALVLVTMFALLLTACGGVTERVNAVKENVVKVQESVEIAKDTIEQASEAIDDAKDLIENIDLDELNLDEGLELPEDLTLENPEEMNDSRDTNTSDDPYTEEELISQQNEAVETINPGAEIIIRDEIDDFSFEELQEDFDAVYTHKDMVVSIAGTSTDSETGTDAIAYDVYFKDGNTHLAAYMNGYHVSVSIYNRSSNTTCTYAIAHPTFKEVVEGNSVPIRLLDITMLEQLQNDEDIIPIYLEDDHGGRYIWFNTPTSSFMYDFDDGLIKWYHEDWSDTEGSYVVDWHVVHINDEMLIEDTLFEW